MSTLITPPPIVKQAWPDLGKYCSYHDATYSASAHALGITDNTPTPAQYACMQHVYAHAIVPVFDHFGPGHINSFFRSGALQTIPGTKRQTSVNAIVNGASDSNHLRGMAVDLDYDKVPNRTNIEVFDWIRQNIPFYELILEFPERDNSPKWVHCATNALDPNRKLIKRAYYDQHGEKKYQIWPWSWH